MREVRPGWIAAALFAAVVVFVLLIRAGEKVAPVPVALWVAVQPEGDDVAHVGFVEIPAGTPFRLHAVMEAETFGGERIYYSEANQIDLGGSRISSDLLNPWGGRFEARVLWFTVEGSPPFQEFRSDEELSAPRFQRIFQPDWGHAWSVTGSIRPTVENFLPGAEQVRRSRRFGTQRFQVRIELFRSKDDLVPELRLASWGPDELKARPEEFPGVVAVLPGVLEEPSRVFGLPQIEFGGARRSDSDQKQIADWTARGLAFSRVAVLANWIKARGVSWEDLVWESAELGVSETAAQPGDLLRVGSRLVWLLDDRGDSGLDDEDWCLDLDRGARVQRLGDVFVGEGLVDWSSSPSGGA